MKNHVQVGVLLPAYNEASVIAKVVAAIPHSVSANGKEYVLTPIVIDDGSSDGTAAIARSDKRVIVIQHLLNSGAGAATRTGLRYLRENSFTLGATMDADGQHNPDDLRKVLLAAIENKADLIIGSRLINHLGMPWHKVMGNKGLSMLTRILLGVNSTDSQSGLKAFNRQVIEKLTYRENGYAFCSEILWRAHQAKLSVAEVPAEAIYTDYSVSKGQSNWNAFNIIKQLVKHRIADILR